MSDLQQLHTDVWTFRGVVYPYWPTPPPLDALRYAVTECGEAMDAYLRQHRQGDSRNSERPDSDEALLNELADCAMMLLTAVNLNVIPEEIQVGNYYLHALVPARHRIEVLCHNVSTAVLAARSDDDETSQVYFSWIYEAIYAARWIETYPGIDLDPASSTAANFTVVGAKTFYSAPQHRVIGKIGGLPLLRYADRGGAIEQACCITFASTSEAWFRPLKQFPMCLIDGRTNYIDPDGEATTGATKGSAVTYLGKRAWDFARNFGQLGAVMFPARIVIGIEHRPD